MNNQTASTHIRNNIYATTDGPKAVGCIAYWELTGRARASVLATALEDMAELDEKDAPRAPSPRQVFQRSCRAAAGRHSAYIMDSRASDLVVFVASEEDIAGSRVPNYKPDMTAELVDGVIVFSDPGHELVPIIQAEFDSRLGRVDTPEVSDWLIGFAKRNCKGVSLRPTGGFYYIPSGSLEQFRAGVAALRSCSAHTVYEIPAMAATETAAAIIAALQVECNHAISEIQAWTNEDRKRQPRSYRTKLGELADLDNKLTAYAEFMDGSLDAVVRSIEDARAQLSQSLLEVEAAA